MYKYYDMKLVTYDIDRDRKSNNTIPSICTANTQKPLTLYQIETIPVLILDMNEKADSYTWIRIDNHILRSIQIPTYLYEWKN